MSKAGEGPRLFQLGKVRAEARWYLEMFELELDTGVAAQVHLDAQARLCEILITLMVELGGATEETRALAFRLQTCCARCNAQSRKRARGSRKHLRVVG